MLSPEARAEQIVARLCAAGFTPRLTDHGAYTCIEIEVPDRVSAETWQEFVAALAEADWFGVAAGSQGRGSAWVAVNKETPAAARAARGRGHQL